MCCFCCHCAPLPRPCRLRIRWGLPGPLLDALPHAAALRRLKIDLEGPYQWGREEDALAYPSLPFQALAALPSVGLLEEIWFTASEGDAAFWELVDGRAKSIGKWR